MATLLEMLKRINQCTTLSQAVHKAIESTTALLDCDRATMFIVDEITDQLVVRDASGSTVDIKIPMTAGIAGSVYTGGELINIPDAYSEPKFNKETDKKTGYTTRSILCCPVYNHDGTTVAVLQAINKKKEGAREEFVPFTREVRNVKQWRSKRSDERRVALEAGCRNYRESNPLHYLFTSHSSQDETLIDYMAGQLGVILMNAKIYEDSVKSKRKVRAAACCCRDGTLLTLYSPSSLCSSNKE
jgi:putative methionine-R-sulfoxide reductase with GAF domain